MDKVILVVFKHYIESKKINIKVSKYIYKKERVVIKNNK